MSLDTIITAVLSIFGYILTYTVSIRIAKKQIDDNTVKFNKNLNMTQKIQLLELRSKNINKITYCMRGLYASLLVFEEERIKLGDRRFNFELKKKLVYNFFFNIQGLENIVNLPVETVKNDHGEIDLIKTKELYFDKNLAKFAIFLANIQEEANKFEILFMDFDTSKNKLLSIIYEVINKLYKLAIEFISFINDGKCNEILLNEIIDGILRLYDYYVTSVKPKTPNPIGDEIMMSIKHVQKINN